MSNKWKDGLPPVGAECEQSWNGGLTWVWCVYRGKTKKGKHIIEDASGKVIYGDGKSTIPRIFRPIKSEADKLREEQESLISNVLHEKTTLNHGQALNAGQDLYDAGCRMTQELPDYDIQQLWEYQDWGVNEVEFTAIAKAIAAYVR